MWRGRYTDHPRSRSSQDPPLISEVNMRRVTELLDIVLPIDARQLVVYHRETEYDDTDGRDTSDEEDDDGREEERPPQTATPRADSSQTATPRAEVVNVAEDSLTPGERRKLEGPWGPCTETSRCSDPPGTTGPNLKPTGADASHADDVNQDDQPDVGQIIDEVRRLTDSGLRSGATHQRETTDMICEALAMVNGKIAETKEVADQAMYRAVGLTKLASAVIDLYRAPRDVANQDRTKIKDLILTRSRQTSRERTDETRRSSQTSIKVLKGRKGMDHQQHWIGEIKAAMTEMRRAIQQLGLAEVVATDQHTDDQADNTGLAHVDDDQNNDQVSEEEEIA
ncbi:hypothetical protein B0I37DRAFT_404083 [Chaetomium sp. MPI-CAGE-AT-0009]|nr:hypothetical protein B0I37DRAFT_404083 [Chaetomium sp. MPI-CAGE-AT-0009]